MINTLLQRPERAELARRFHQQRVEQLFLRFARTGRDFYAMEQNWPEQVFWQSRSRWPDAEPMHAAADFSEVRVQRAPVIRGHLIEEVEVVITPDQPLGIWHMQGIELAPLLRALRAGAGVEEVLDRVAPERRAMLRAWLGAQGCAI